MISKISSVSLNLLMTILCPEINGRFLQAVWLVSIPLFAWMAWVPSYTAESWSISIQEYIRRMQDMG